MCYLWSKSNANTGNHRSEPTLIIEFCHLIEILKSYLLLVHLKKRLLFLFYFLLPEISDNSNIKLRVKPSANSVFGTTILKLFFESSFRLSQQPYTFTSLFHLRSSCKQFDHQLWNLWLKRNSHRYQRKFPCQNDFFRPLRSRSFPSFYCYN